MPLLNTKRPPSYSLPAVRTLSFRERTGTTYEPIAVSPAAKNSRFLNTSVVSAAPGPHFLPLKVAMHIATPIPGVPHRMAEGGTYTLSSVAGSVASDPLLKRGMSPKPQERC